MGRNTLCSGMHQKTVHQIPANHLFIIERMNWSYQFLWQKWISGMLVNNIEQCFISRVLLDLWMELPKLATRLLCTEMDVGTLSLRNIPGSRKSQIGKENENVKTGENSSLIFVKTLRYFFIDLLIVFCASNASSGAFRRVWTCLLLRSVFSVLEHPLDFRLHQGSHRRIPQFLPQILGKLLCT